MGYIEIPDVTLEMIIEAGIIEPNTKVYNTINESVIGTLNRNGSISLNINGETKNFPYPSGAARAIVNLSVNGWVFWKIMENGVLNDLTVFKKRYLDELKKN